MTGSITEIWSYLSREPLLWLTATLCAYAMGDWISQISRRNPWANPVLIAVILLGCALWILRTDYPTYFEGAQFIHFLLGPATVALAVPLHANLDLLRRSAIAIAAALVAGSSVAAISAVGLSLAFGLPDEVVRSISAKSATAPVALGISEALGGSPTLTAVLVILTGLVGAVTVTPLMNALRIKDWRARGFAAGVAAHGLGTARAFQVNETAGTFAGLGMALNAILTAIIVPLVVLAML